MGSCSLLNGGSPGRVKDSVSSALSFYMSPLTVPPCLGMKGPSCAMTATKGVQSPLAVPEVKVLSTHLLLGSLFSLTSCCCQVCSFIAPPFPPCRLPGHLLGRDALTSAGPRVLSRGQVNSDSAEEGN